MLSTSYRKLKGGLGHVFASELLRGGHPWRTPRPQSDWHKRRRAKATRQRGDEAVPVQALDHSAAPLAPVSGEKARRLMLHCIWRSVMIGRDPQL